MTDDTQARAARLTAIAEQACNGSKGPGQIEFEIEELIADALRENARLNAEYNPRLALAGCRQSLERLTTLGWAKERLENSKVIAGVCYESDRDGWLEDVIYWEQIVTLLAHVETLTQQVAELTAWKARYADNVAEWEHRAEQAEQQRDAAHAALEQTAAEMRNAVALADVFNVPVIDAEGLLGWANQLDAALAASAPQQEGA